MSDWKHLTWWRISRPIYGIDKLTSISTEKARIDSTKATLKFAGKEYKLSPVGTAAQEQVLTEGPENWRKERL